MPFTLTAIRPQEVAFEPAASFAADTIEPGRHRGEPVAVRFSLPVRFQLPVEPEDG